MAQDEIRKYKMVVIGGSAGSLEVILKMITSLSTDSGASFIIVIHRKNESGSVLENILSNRTSMPVKEVEDKEILLPNAVYIAPPDYHLLVDDEHTFSLDASEKVHYSRPSIDITFESVAEVFGSRVIGVLLSGANADGAAGLNVIKQKGGFAIVQNPQTADVGFMPQQAIKLGAYNKVLNADEIASFLQHLLSLKP